MWWCRWDDIYIDKAKNKEEEEIGGNLLGQGGDGIDGGGLLVAGEDPLHKLREGIDSERAEERRVSLLARVGHHHHGEILREVEAFPELGLLASVDPQELEGALRLLLHEFLQHPERLGARLFVLFNGRQEGHQAQPSRIHTPLFPFLLVLHFIQRRWFLYL